METDVHLQSYLPQFFLQKKYFQAKFVEKIKKNRLISIICFRKSCNLRDNVEKYCRAGQTTDDNMAMRNACWIPKSTNTHSECVTRIAFPQQQCLG